MSGGDLALGPRWLYPAKAAATTARSAAWLLRTRARETQPGVRILFYHRVCAEHDELGVTPGRFRAQMDELARRGLRAVGVDTVARTLAAGGDANGLVGLSFDDGYQDVVEHALPSLARHGFSATVFVATGVTDGRARFTWYDEQPQLMSWDTIRSLDGAGVLRFEAHTITHPNLLQLSDDDLRREVHGSKTELEEQLGRPVSAFCYPAGLFGARERDCVEQAGFSTAVSCEPGVNTAATDRLALRRRQIDRRDTMLDFRAKVAGGHDTPPRLRGVYRRLRYGAPA